MLRYEYMVDASFLLLMVYLQMLAIIIGYRVDQESQRRTAAQLSQPDSEQLVESWPKPSQLPQYECTLYTIYKHAVEPDWLKADISVASSNEVSSSSFPMLSLLCSYRYLFGLKLETETILSDNRLILGPHKHFDDF